MQKHRQRFYQQQQQRHGATDSGQVAYEEKVKALDFAADDYDGDDDADTEAERILNRSRFRQRGNPRVDDGRQRSRVMTRPVVMPTTATPNLVLHPEVRMRPLSAHTSNSNYNKGHSPIMSHQPQTPSHLSVQSSAVARKAAANQRRPQQQQKQQEQQHQQQQYDDTDWRPRSRSESSFGGGLFFGWRRPSYQQYAEAGTATAQQPPAAQYRGKNLHNFSYADAKIYSPHSHHQQQQQQQQQQHRQRQQVGNRAKIWWTMDTIGAVNSSHSNQIMLAKDARN